MHPPDKINPCTLVTYLFVEETTDYKHKDTTNDSYERIIVYDCEYFMILYILYNKDIYKIFYILWNTHTKFEQMNVSW